MAEENIEEVIKFSPLWGNNPVLYRFKKEYIDQYFLDPSSKTHLDVGHGKLEHLKFSRHIANFIGETGGKVIYFDNASFFDKFDIWMKKLRGKRAPSLPENLIFTSNPEQYLINPDEPPFDSASFFFTAHEFTEAPTAYETIMRIKPLLRQRGYLFIVDYDLDLEAIRRQENQREFLQEIFTNGNEKKAIESEPDFVVAHTRYNLEKCIQDTTAAGFKTTKIVRTNPRKLFLYIGKKESVEEKIAV